MLSGRRGLRSGRMGAPPRDEGAAAIEAAAVVALREWQAWVRSRAFQLGTLVGLVAAVVAFGAGMPGRQGPLAPQRAGEALAVLVDTTATADEELVERLRRATGLTWQLWPAQDPQALELAEQELAQLARQGRLAAWVELRAGDTPAPAGGDGDVVWEVGGQLSAAQLQALQAVADAEAVRRRLRAAGLAEREVARLMQPALLLPRQLRLVPQSPPGWDGPGWDPSLAWLLMVYVGVVVAGTGLTNGIASERQGRVLEMLLAAATPRQLLRGRMVGSGLAVGLQFALWSAAAVLASRWRGGGSVGEALAAGVVFLASLAGFAPLFALAGSLAARPEETSHTTWIPMLALLGSYAACLAAAVRPEAAWVTAGSLVPLAGPLLLWVRWQFSSVPAWQLAVAAAAHGLACYGLQRWAEGVYARCAVFGQEAARSKEQD